MIRPGSIRAAVLLLAVSFSAQAQPLTGLFRWQVSRDGLSWSSSLTLAAGDSYKIRGVASWVDGATPSVGFAGCTFEQIDLIGAGRSDVFGVASGEGSVPTYLTRLQAKPENWTLQTGTGASAFGLTLDHINPASHSTTGPATASPAGPTSPAMGSSTSRTTSSS